MKKSVNLNYIWSKFFVEQLVSHGLKNVCISPGSRSTPLTTAFAENKKITKHVIVDERSSAFFALGLAKASGLPTAIVTTSGTAAANLYPAIIEAYKSRIPLIVCTTDRPEYLRNTGANQTITQNDIYKNHIRYSKDIAVPKPTLKIFSLLQKITSEAYTVSTIKNRGPVHLNFQFEKPLEKSLVDTKLDAKFIEKISLINSAPTTSLISTSKTLQIKKSTLEKINKIKKGLILVGWDNYSNEFQRNVIRLSETTAYPILVDGASGLFFNTDHKNIIVNHQAFLRSEKLESDLSPELIIQFGNAPTSNAMLDFIKKSSAHKVAINRFGDRLDSGSEYNTIIKEEPSTFCEILSENLDRRTDRIYLKYFINADEKVEKLKLHFLNKTKINDEISIVKNLIDILPDKCNLFVSNSLPIRDLEFFKSRTKKNIKLFVNRGASGIDGINSTAAGIAASSKSKTFLLTGDLSFFHDSNGMHTLSKYNIPLTIILINNGGGAIFGMLPISKEKDIFDDYFFTPLNLKIADLVKTYGGIYSSVNSFSGLAKAISKSRSAKTFSVIEIKTDYKKGIELRKDYFRKVINEIEN